jgi:hypothetical protein
MDIKKLKGSVQLAQLRYKSDPSEANKTILDNAVQAYESAQKSESEKNEQVSGHSASEAHSQAQIEGEKQLKATEKATKNAAASSNVVAPATTAEGGDASGNIPEGTNNSGEPAAKSETAEKKTEEQA